MAYTHSTPMTGRAQQLQPLRLAFVSVHGDPLAPLGSEGAGGQNVYVRHLAGYLAGRGHQVDVFTRAVDGVERVVPVEPGFRVVRLEAGPPGYVARQAMLPHLPAFVTGLERYARSERHRYDVMHSHYWLSGYVGVQMAERWRLPLVHTSHSLGAVKYAVAGSRPEGDLRLQIEQQVLSTATTVVATSPQEIQDIRSLYGISPVMRHIPCGVDVDRFRPLPAGPARTVLGIPEGAFVLVYVGRLDPNKGIETLLRAASRLRGATDVHVLVAGGFQPGAPDEREYLRLRALVDELDLVSSVQFLGPCSQEQLPLVYAAADAVAVLSDYESFGITAIEAMACGKPVVASRVGGLAHSVVDGETGWLVRSRQPQDVVEACRRLLRDPEAARRMGAQGRRRVIGQYSWKQVATSMEEAYSQVLAARLASRRTR